MTETIALPVRLSKSGGSIKDANDRIIFRVRDIKDAEQFIEDAYQFIDAMNTRANQQEGRG